MISPIAGKLIRKRRATRAPITSEEAARVPHPKAAAISGSSPKRGTLAQATRLLEISVAVASTSLSHASGPDWSPFEPPKAPDGAPSVLYIVLDNVGLSVLMRE
jgi:hypothetical protein